MTLQRVYYHVSTKIINNVTVVTKSKIVNDFGLYTLGEDLFHLQKSKCEELTLK